MVTCVKGHNFSFPANVTVGGVSWATRTGVANPQLLPKRNKDRGREQGAPNAPPSPHAEKKLTALTGALYSCAATALLSLLLLCAV